jgi:rhodanese-related sulfurtransferase
MKFQKLALALSVALTLSVFTGCSEDDDDDNTTPVDEFALMSELTDTGFAGWTTGWVQGADYVHTNLANLYVVDLRSAADFAAGHIAGAHNATLTTMADNIATNNTSDLPVAVVCYTGQTSAFATMALRMLGWTDAFSMKWGMGGWNDALNTSWATGISNAYVGNMVTSASPALGTFEFPALNTGLTDGQAILEARVNAILAEGLTPNIVTAATVMATSGDYQIFNYWSAAHYAVGHIDGSYQLTPGNLTTTTDLDALDPADQQVLYCYTGQTSALVGFYLNALGYDVLSLKYGANALYHDTMPANAWAATGFNYELVTN